jgi:hypothetical protein
MLNLGSEMRAVAPCKQLILNDIHISSSLVHLTPTVLVVLFNKRSIFNIPKRFLEGKFPTQYLDVPAARKYQPREGGLHEDPISLKSYIMCVMSS